MSSLAREVEGGRWHWSYLVWSGVVFVLALALYGATVQRGVSWQDSGIFQHRILTGSFTDLGDGGLAVVHPWYLKVGRWFCLCFPEGQRVVAVNLFSGVGAAVALGLLMLLVLRMTRGRLDIALAAAVSVGVAQMTWWLATIAEVYTWSLAFIFAELLVVVGICEGSRGGRGWYLWPLLMFVNGMHASLHNVALLNLPVYGVLWLWGRARGHGPGHTVCRVGMEVFGCVLGWLVGGWWLVEMVVGELVRSGELVATVKSWLVGTGYGATVMGVGGVNLKLALSNIALGGISFATPCYVFALLAVRGCEGGRVLRWVLGGLLAIQGFFWVRYFVPDQATFVLPTLGLVAVWMALGAQRFAPRVVVATLVVGVVVQVGVLPMALPVVQRYVSRMRELPFRDEGRYWLLPWKHNEESAQRFVEAVDGQLEEGDMLVGDLTAVNPVVVAQAAGELSSDRWRLVSQWSGESVEEVEELVADGVAAGRGVYVVSPVAGYTYDSILQGYDFEQEGVLWRVRSR